MNLETQIANLERQLQLKKAFQSVQFTFGKGYKAFPDDIRAEVEEHLRKVADAQGTLLEPLSSETGVNGYSDIFTDEEVGALKLLAASVLKKKPESVTPSVITSPHKTTAQAVDGDRFKFRTQAPPPEVGGLGTLLMLDNIHKSQRSRVASGSDVAIVDANDTHFLARDFSGNQFWVPKDDIQLKETK